MLKTWSSPLWQLTLKFNKIGCFHLIHIFFCLLLDGLVIHGLQHKIWCWWKGTSTEVMPCPFSFWTNWWSHTWIDTVDLVCIRFSSSHTWNIFTQIKGNHHSQCYSASAAPPVWCKCLGRTNSQIRRTIMVPWPGVLKMSTHLMTSTQFQPLCLSSSLRPPFLQAFLFWPFVSCSFFTWWFWNISTGS